MRLFMDFAEDATISVIRPRQSLRAMDFFGAKIYHLTTAMHSVGIDPEPDTGRTLEYFFRAWEKVRGLEKLQKK